MTMLIRIAAIVVGMLATASAQIDKRDEGREVSRFAFGSCVRTERPQHVWDSIAKTDPDVWIWLGDNIYADIPRPGTGDPERDAEIVLERMPGLYATLGAVPGYRKLAASALVLGTWDDHDYGINDAGVEFPGKARAQELFMDFFGEPAESERRKTPGVYGSWTFGKKGRRVQVIVLDTRSFRSPLVRGDDNPREKWVSGIPGYYLPSSDEDATILGDAQWQWLGRILREPAELRVVVSSIQVVSNDHRFEKWGNFPAERRRLFERIAATNANGVVFLSGDRHSGEISRLDPDRAKIGSFVDVGYPVYDVTSSALTNSAPTVPGESEGSSRSGFVQYSDERNRHRIGSHIRYNNFGTLTVDWDAAGGALLTMRLYTDRGRELIREVVRIDSLRSRTAR